VRCYTSVSPAGGQCPWHTCHSTSAWPLCSRRISGFTSMPVWTLGRYSALP
jgi:hypothetical protein